MLAVDPARRAVRIVAALPTPVAHAPLVALNGMLYLVGGTDPAGGALERVWRMDPVSGRVTSAGSLPEPLADAAAVVLGRRVIVLGGTRGSQGASQLVLAFRPERR